MPRDRKSTGIWLAITLPIAILIPILCYLLVSLLARGATKIYDSTKGDYTNVAFWIGNIPVYWYGIFIFFGFVCAIALGCFKLWKLYKCPIDPFYWFCLMGIPIAIIGANFGSCVLGDGNGGKSWSDFFGNNFGKGLAIEWGVMFVVAAALIYFPLVLKQPKYQVRDLSTEPVKVKPVSMWVYVDAIVPAIFIGQIIGRLGNYMNQEVYGSNVTGSWADLIEKIFPYMNVGGEVKEPLFLYEAIGNFVGLLLIYFGLEFVKRLSCGDLGLFYFLWYGVLRASLNPLRDDRYAGNNVSITVSVIWGVAAILLIIFNHTIFLKARNHKIFASIKSRLKLSLYPIWVRSLEKNINKENSMMRDISFTNDIEEKEELKNKINITRAKITDLRTRIDKLQYIKNNLRINFIRNEDEKLYYLGR